MNFEERPLVIDVGSERLLGIATDPAQAHECGVLIAVGGPQYRVGSHRQFVLLARALAMAGYPSLRFDYRGMGDSSGDIRSFESVSEDIAAAIEAFQHCYPGVRRIVLWGLCDAASAILLYLDERRDTRVAGVVLLNPWVRSESSLAQTHLKHYYGRRLLQPAFWGKLLSGRMNLFGAVRELARNALRARSATRPQAVRSFQERMASGLREFSGETLLLLSGQDYTAREFQEVARTSNAWAGLLENTKVACIDIPDADHTFSSHALRQRVEAETAGWLARLR